MSDKPTPAAYRGAATLRWLIIGVLGFAALIVGLSRFSSSSDSSPGPAVVTDSSAAAAALTCKALVRAKLSNPVEFDFEPFTMKRRAGGQAFVGRGEVAMPDRWGGPIIRRFICMIDPDSSGGGYAVFRETDPGLFKELLGAFHLE